MWRALVSHLVVCCPPQQGQKSQQRLSIFYVERNYEEWGWWDPEGRSHKLRAYSGRHLRRSGVVWSRLEKKKEDSLRIVINGRTIKDNKLYGYRWGENIRPHMPPPFAIPIRLPSTSSFLCCASDLRKREAQWRILIVFFFPSDCFFFCVAMSDVLTSHLHFSAQSGWLSVFAFLLCFDQEKKKQTLGSLN